MSIEFFYSTAVPLLCVFQEYVLCRDETKDPRVCLSENKALSRCRAQFMSEVGTWLTSLKIIYTIHHT